MACCPTIHTFQPESAACLHLCGGSDPDKAMGGTTVSLFQMPFFPHPVLRGEWGKGKKKKCGGSLHGRKSSRCPKHPDPSTEFLQ